MPLSVGDKLGPYEIVAHIGYSESAVADRITKVPDVCGGRASIAGHRVRVLDVVIWHE